MKLAVLTTVAAAAAWCTAGAFAQMASDCPKHAEHQAAQKNTSPYASEETRPIAGLPAERLAALREGTGHGMALPAELNHYPGPRHVLDLATQLGLEDGQASALRVIFDRMHARAVAIGEAIVEGERALDRLFESGKATSEEVVRLTGRIAALEGELRATHLTAHVEAKALLSAEQVSRYDAARGYASGAE